MKPIVPFTDSAHPLVSAFVDWIDSVFQRFKLRLKRNNLYHGVHGGGRDIARAYLFVGDFRFCIVLTVLLLFGWERLVLLG